MIVCLALVLFPVAMAGASHYEIGIGVAHAPDGQAEAPASDDEGNQAPICHQLGACHAFLAPPAPSFTHRALPLAVALAATKLPPKAAPHRLFRPPRSAVSA